MVEKKELTKVESKGLKTTSDKFIDVLADQASLVMSNMGLELKPEVKNAIFNLGLACEKAIKDKGINWEQISKDGLPSKILYYAQLNLNPANNELYILPYQKGDKYVLNFEESYLGKRKKVKKFSADELVDTITFVVREGDLYQPDIDLMNGDTVEFKPKSFNNGPIIGAVCYLKYKDASKNRIVEMTIDDLEKIKEASKAKMNGKLSPAWKNWEAQMYQKAVLKRALKDVVIEVPSEYQSAYINTEIEDNSNYDMDFEEKTTIVITPTEEIKEAEYEEHQEIKEETNGPKIAEFE